MKTNIAYRTFAALCVVLLFACSAHKANKNSKYTSSYVYAYTAGPLAKTSPIRVRFASDVTAQDQVGKPLANNIFSISPSLKGKATWEDAQTLVFQPEEAMKEGKNYVASIRLDRLFQGVPGEAKEFQFDFRAKQQYFDFLIEGMQTKELNNLSEVQVQGYVTTADAADDKKVEDILKATQNGQNLNISWSHNDNHLKHSFWVNGVKRGDIASSVNLNWNGKALNVTKTGSATCEIPALNDFKVISIKEIDGEDKQVVINFSDPIASEQDLTGLIHFDQIQSSNCVVDKNIVRLYSNSPFSGNLKTLCEVGIKNSKGKSFEKGFTQSIFFGDSKPKVRLCGHGSIIPSSENGLLFPFEATNLNAVSVEIFKIFDNNVMQFLQTSDLDNNYDYGLERVGRVILQKKVALSEINTASNKGKFVRYNLDLSKLIKEDHAAVYQVRIGFKPDYSAYECKDAKAKSKIVEADDAIEYDENGDIKSFSSYGYEDEYNGEENATENPCSPSYYTYRNYIKRNVIASNIGVIAKMGNDKSVFVAVTDLRSTQAIPSAEVEFFDFQNQKIASTKTNSEGICKLQLEKIPFICLVNVNKEYGYLKMQDGTSNNMSRFAVGGDIIQKGIKGFIYGERGVWRPGDSIFLNFVLENKNRDLPPNHPITFELKDPRGQIQQRFTTTYNLNNIYNLTTSTRPDAPTGSYIATVKVGGAAFTKEIKIETVKPNRLKIKLDFGKEQLAASDAKLLGNLQSNWLTGPVAAGLTAKVDVQLVNSETKFERFGDYKFDDPARTFTSEPQTLFDAALDANGHANIPLNFNIQNKTPGKLKANFSVRVMERGGDFSVDNFNMIYNPYEVYVGVRMPENKQGEKEANINENTQVRFIALDKNGNPAKNIPISVGLYRINWRWWWDSNNDEVNGFNSDAHLGSLETATITTNEKGEALWNVKVAQWGRYFVRGINPSGGHATGDFFNAGMPYYEDGENDEAMSAQARKAAALLPFKSDKEKYSVGEKVTLDIPASKVGRCLVTIENGTKVLQHFWADAKEGTNKIEFKSTAEMSPTVYAHVAMIQKHGQVTNDLPMRQYGVVPINVENTQSRLEPWVNMPDVLEPEQNFTVDVGEMHGKSMTYTLAIVDEGLLDLTRFQTPDPWKSFYAKEALGVKTWDIYDQVLSASYGVEQDRVLNIGGDGINTKAGENNRANRFKPIVRHIGPFYLAPGRKGHHQIKLPNYIGSVRVMVVAADNGAYGNTAKTVPVRKPLMLLATLPRVLSPGETLKLPVDIFAMDKKVTNVNISVQESSGLINIINGSSKSMFFNAPGEKPTDFDIKVNDGEGVAKFRILAEGGGEKVWQDIEIQVRNPNPNVTNVIEKVMNANESADIDFQALGTYGTNEGVLEISTIPPLNLGTRLPYLLQYPHGCVEQTTSSAFPQLYVSKLLELTENQKNIASNNVKAGIESLQRFQNDAGGFGYWPGYRDADDWGTSYVGQFLIEAEKSGFTLPPSMLERWKSYQQNMARRWEPVVITNNPTNNPYDYDTKYWAERKELDQAYRLYTLAAAGAAELGAMNRLREQKNLSVVAKWRLAAAYCLAGKIEEAKNLTNSATKFVAPYTEISYTYGSDLRDEAQILETLLLMGDKNGAAEIARSVAGKLSSQTWYGTQSVAQSLLSVSKYLGGNTAQNGFTYTYKTDKNGAVNANCKAALSQVVISVDKGVRKVFIKNTSKAVLFARLILSGKPAIGNQDVAANNLEMSILYKNTKGEMIDPTRITQGTDFVAEVTVQNPGTLGRTYKEMALSQVFPSGWEIHNARMGGMTYGTSSIYDYQDIRDDRVYTYFDLPKNQSVTYRVQLHAAYIGKYYLPTTVCEAMYDHNILAKQGGKWVDVVKKEGEM
jgi:alpha-2-macroglobulin